MQNQEGTPWEEPPAYMDDDSEEDSDDYFSDDSCDLTSVKITGWESLSLVCLQNVFRFLPDRDRRSAALVCRHWRYVMSSPSLWRTRVFHFTGRISKYRPSEHRRAVGYVTYLGCYLERLEVSVFPPHTSLVAQRLENVISEMFAALVSVKAPLRHLSLKGVELERHSWTPKFRYSLVKSLVCFLKRGASKLTTLSLNGMRSNTIQGTELLSAFSACQRRLRPWSTLASLDIQGFFSTSANMNRVTSGVTAMLCDLRNLTSLSLSYSCLSDEVLTILQQSHRGGRWTSDRDGKALQTLSLHCSLNEPHEQMVSGRLWATLASSCADLRVRLSVDRIINKDCLARILLPEIPVEKYSMTAFFSPDEDWSVKPVLCDMLPQYRSSLQHLTLDLSNISESLDEELLELVKVCVRLERLKLGAFLNIGTVGRLLHIRLTQRTSLNKIRLRIYAQSDNAKELADQLEETLSSHQHLPPELSLYATVHTFV
ncbi:F-box only protein 39-like [Mugil cephalus]|uniref:F-box only protein 39-like n=1 Tax=Mugil cephalus TaxID=48193 RepID=UPI001FB8447D|nr:F-box only protein 39-like [Mugil cephalus]